MAVAPRAVRLWSNAGTYAFLGIVCLLMLVPIVSLAGVTLTIGLAAEPFVDYASRAAAQLLDKTAYIDAALGTQTAALENTR